MNRKQDKKGHNFDPAIKWSHNWYHNFPFIYAPRGSHDFAVRGNGVIRMMGCSSGDDCMKLAPLSFYRRRDFVIEGVHITDYHSYAVMPFTCSGGLFKDMVIDNWSYGNGDGIRMMNCRDMRVTGCRMRTGDDSVYFFPPTGIPGKANGGIRMSLRPARISRSITMTCSPTTARRSG